ncbi:MAG TPA: bifunctional DNA-binding transcriptional regulator/O6-methylguanine-DNA methyltransferase Ada [Aromatoleum sp.]|uniref:bifunctional DNA-binding transcriptional regulator/O6-methylguanine-DNA methyltransferase Ada n=1 Tax=Aromatoleum sp. TaxID=2307007 RepID=UPI002B483AC6|nr:bifunctional DNA-binding transcriptional regulator/O6-methylguanine-DNA methyltransferase Ada [Aromatoleum sp.]HJV24893.1 bifunctional DNA-binding transcriptional regulator/O6-methylguanine-DNA methyltransferase Ada [Aromatoleum sp.]
MDNVKASQAAAIQGDPRWSAVVSRAAEADGSFVYAVKTTGVYCRPSCGSRRARPENVAFFATPVEAEHAGFRACRRCQPDQMLAPAARQSARIVELCRLIETAEHIPSLAELAAQSGLSPYHLHREFKRVTGLTPRAYATAHRAKRIRRELQRSNRVTDAIYEAGYASNGRFYAESDAVLGMTPAAFRRGGPGTEIRFAVGRCSLGAILVARSERGICAILLGDDPQALVDDLQAHFPAARLVAGDADFDSLVAQVVGFVEAPATGLDLPLDIRGTAFQQRVWQALQKIPPGERISYTELAQRIGAPAAVRAVAGACAANALAVAIPCHRVVRNDGGLAGYRWGIERKRSLLERETEGR